LLVLADIAAASQLKAWKIRVNVLLIQWDVGSSQCHLFGVGVWFKMGLLGLVGFEGGDGFVVGSAIRKSSLASSASMAVDCVDGSGLGRVLVMMVGLQRA